MYSKIVLCAFMVIVCCCFSVWRYLLAFMLSACVLSGSAVRALILFLLFFFVSSKLLSLVVGSDSAVSRQSSLVTFPTVDTDNEMRGFTAVNTGFTLQSATTTCTFNALLPVVGDATFNNGYLYLNKDLSFANPFRFMNGGRIRGNSKAVEFPETVTDLTVPVSSGVLLFDGAVLKFNSNIVLGGLWKFRGACKVIGNGKKLTISSGGAIELADQAQLILQDVALTNIGSVGIGSSNVRCLTNNASIIFQDSILYLARDFTFSKASLVFDRDVLISGTSKFSYTSAQVSTISSGATLYLDNGVTFSYSPSTSNKNLLVMTDQTSGLYLDGATLVSTITGLRLSTGTLYIDNAVTFSSQARNSGEALELSSSLNIQSLVGAMLDVFGIIKYV